MSGSTATPPEPVTHPLPGFPLVRMVAGGWWVFVLRGVASILFGLLAFIMPGLSLAVILGFLAAWMAVDGVGSIYQAVRGGAPAAEGQEQAQKAPVWLWVDGIIALLAAATVLLAPGISALGLVMVTGAWFIISGGARLMLAFRMSSILLGILGVLTVLAGAWLIVNPGPGLLALIWLVGLEAIAMGVLMIGLGLRLRRIHDDPHHKPGQTQL